MANATLQGQEPTPDDITAATGSIHAPHPSMTMKGKYADLIRTARDRDYVAWFEPGSCHVNLAGDYDYLKDPYYISQRFENQGRHLLPTCKEMLDAYVPPILLEKAQRAGIPVPRHYVSSGYFEPQVIIDPVNPFMTKSRIVMRAGRELAIARSMTRNHTYAMCCQVLPSGGQARTFRSVLGWCTSPRFRHMSRIVWDVFHIPLATVRVIVAPRKRMLLSDISPLNFEKLLPSEYEFVKENVRWAR